MSKLVMKREALDLRRKGHTFTEIAATLSISKSTASTWCQDVVLSSVALSRLSKTVGDGRMKGRLIGARINKEFREQRVEQAQEWAQSVVGSLSSRDLLLAGIGLYWGEGAKSRKLDFTNSDPRLLMFVKSWFEQALKVKKEDFLVRICINESHKDRYERVKRFWVKTLKLPANQFYKPTFIKTPQRKVYENRETYYGVVSLRVKKSTDLQYRILGLIQALGNADVAQLVRAQHS